MIHRFRSTCPVLECLLPNRLLLLVPLPHLLRCLVRNGVDRVERRQPVLLVKHIRLAPVALENRPASPRKRPPELLAARRTAIRVELLILHSAQPQQCVARVVRIRVSMFPPALVLATHVYNTGPPIKYSTVRETLGRLLSRLVTEPSLPILAARKDVSSQALSAAETARR